MAQRQFLVMLSLLQSFWHSSGYYQQPEVVQFTTPPRDAVVCQGCEINLSCSILRQSSAAGEGRVPMPELEWIFNGTRIEHILSDARVLVRDSATHRTAELSITNATAFHNGIYQCRAKDGSDSTVCSGGTSFIPCLPTTTISTPARIQIVGDSLFVKDVNSCSGVVVLPCGRSLMGGASVERPTLTWTRNGVELTTNSDREMVLLNGDLVINSGSDDEQIHYECVATFNTAGSHNITLARYNVTGFSHSDSEMDDFVRITSSVETVFEGESVELVCEAFLEDDDPCLPYNVTWRSSSLVSGRDHQSDGHALLNNGSGNSLQMNGHVLRISRVLRTSRYCCLVHSDGDTMEECIVISVTQLHPNVSSVNSSTVFLGRRGASNVTQIDCSPSPSSSSSSPASQHTSNVTSNVTWYRNGQLLANVTNSTLYLTVTSDEPLTSDVFGVYQCFRADSSHHSVEEISITRVLPFGFTNPPSVPVIQSEVPYPDPTPSDGVDQAAFLVVWDPPLLAGGLSISALRYNVTIMYSFSEYNQVLTSDTHSLLVYMLAFEFVRISVVVVVNSTEESYFEVASQQISETGPQFITFELQSQCSGQVLYPPTLSLYCGYGWINLTWHSSSLNSDIAMRARRDKNIYAIGNCTRPDGSIHQFDTEGNFDGTRVFSEYVFGVGSHCQFSMASALAASCSTEPDCFCFDPRLIQYSNTSECYVHGFAEFVYTNLQSFENETSVEICVRTRGYGFSVNVSTVEQTAIAGYDYVPLTNHQLSFIDSSGVLNQTHCFNITIMNNNVLEDTSVKSFDVVLTNDNSFVTLGTDRSVVQIVDDDRMGFVLDFTESTVSVSENAGAVQLCVNISDSVQLESNVSVEILSKDSTARAGIDYLFIAETLIFSPGQETTKCFNVTIIDDNIFERSKVFILFINSQNRTLPVEIVDDEYPRVTFDQSQYTTSESDGQLEICVSIDLELERDVTVSISSHDNTTESGEDYQPVDSIIQYSPGQEKVVCTNISISDDDVVEGTEYFTLLLDFEDSVQAEAVVYILDNEYGHIVTFDQPLYTINESDGVLPICVSLLKNIAVTVPVQVYSTDITAIGAEEDYSLANETLLFIPGDSTVQCFNVSIIDDSIFELEREVFTVSLLVFDEVIDVNVTIIDNDDVTVSFYQSVYIIRKNHKRQEICVFIDGERDVPISVAAYSQDGTAEAGSDYHMVDEILTFIPGENKDQCFDVSISDNSFYKDSKEFVLLLSANGDYGSRVLINESTVTVLGSDKPKNKFSAMVIGISVGVVSFVILLAMAASISCLLMVLHRIKRNFIWNVTKFGEANEEEEVDENFEPPIIITADTQFKRNRDIEDDSMTVLNYLLSKSPSLASTDLSKSSSTSLSEEDILKADDKIDKHPSVTAYNVSLESGVVLEDRETQRKISDGSDSLSHGSHSYIGTSQTITCSCTECKIHRERTHSGQTDFIT